MTVLVMAAIGFIVGFALDEVIARLAREPYERGEMEEDDLRPSSKDGAALELGSETGALAMPRALTTGSQWRRVGVVAATVVVYALIASRYESANVLEMTLVSAYAAVLIACTGTDLLAYRVPNVITYPAILVALAAGMLLPDANRGDVALGGVLTGGTFLAMAIVTRGGMGLGDVKLAFFTGFALGLELGILALLLTAISGGLVAVLLMATRIRGRRDPIPYGPFIAGGALWVILMEGTAFFQL